MWWVRSRRHSPLVTHHPSFSLKHTWRTCESKQSRLLVKAFLFSSDNCLSFDGSGPSFFLPLLPSDQPCQVPTPGFTHRPRTRLTAEVSLHHTAGAERPRKLEETSCQNETLDYVHWENKKRKLFFLPLPEPDCTFWTFSVEWLTWFPLTTTTTTNNYGPTSSHQSGWVFSIIKRQQSRSVLAKLPVVALASLED